MSKMPRKSKKSSNKRLKQMITSRLIEISHRVEDYVYHQKPISETEAKQYVNEVLSFKTQCLQDDRSLQVIEKLTRCMNSIINDYQELREGNRSIINGSPVPINDNYPRSISPVYSLSDEDRALFTQAPENNDEILTQPNNEIDIIDICSDDDDVNRVPETSKDYSSLKINVDVDIHRALSNLTLKEVEEVPINSIFSQSILNNFSDFEKAQHDKVTVTSVKPITDNKFVVKDINTDNTVQNKTVRQIERSDRNVYIESDTNSNFNQIPAVDLTVDTKECYTGNTVIPQSHDTNAFTQPIKYLKIASANKSAENLPANKSSAFQNVKNATKPNKSTKSKVNNKESVVIKNTDSATKKKRGRKKTGAEIEKEKLHKNVTKKRQAPKRPKGFAKAANIQPIYNTNIENDLSWIENIRYVREIRPDENDPKMNLEESFWDNYYLPADWNDNEFW